MDCSGQSGTAYHAGVTKVAMILKGKTQPGRREALRQMFEQHLAPRANANPAQEMVVWCADNTDVDAFYLFEVYSDLAAMQANAQASWFAEYLAKAGSLLDGQPEVVMATPAFTKPSAR